MSKASGNFSVRKTRLFRANKRRHCRSVDGLPTEWDEAAFPEFLKLLPSLPKCRHQVHKSAEVAASNFSQPDAGKVGPYFTPRCHLANSCGIYPCTCIGIVSAIKHAPFVRTCLCILHFLKLRVYEETIYRSLSTMKNQPHRVHQTLIAPLSNTLTLCNKCLRRDFDV